MRVTDLIETPDGRDEIGTPDEHLERCPNCGALYRVDGWHRCPDGTEVSPA
ncbi:hypothetical protein [Salinilacihabitans rarus]|uniref:hypothetical protein n=1 Tax=Salinilacihabitans rarus TaxID=2961596 RepID=UPI0020C8526A|nr:hypothetical protein [Salinilacihabitans rarus]